MAIQDRMSRNGQGPQVHDYGEVPSISVQALWKVFGKNPDKALQEEHRDKGRAEIQQELDLVVALRDVSFEVTPGETFVVMGLSGNTLIQIFPPRLTCLVIALRAASI